jgi:Major Facilitator Superfamily.
LKETVAGVVDTGGFSKKGIRRFFQVEHKNCYTEGALESEKPPKVGWFSILKISGIPFLFAVYFLTFFAFSLFYAGLPVYAKTMLGWSVIDLGLFLAYSSLIMAFVQGVAVSKISKIVSSPILVLVGSLFLGTSLILIANENIFIMYVGNTMLSLGNGIMWPSFLSILSSKGDKALQGTIQGYGTSMGSIASMFGLVIGGILFEAIGTNVFLLGAGVFFLITVLMLFQSLKNRMIGLRQAKPRPTTNS